MIYKFYTNRLDEKPSSVKLDKYTGHQIILFHQIIIFNIFKPNTSTFKKKFYVSKLTWHILRIEMGNKLGLDDSGGN